MAILEDIGERGMGWPLGIGLAVLAVSAGPKLVKAGRPLVKRAIKGYLMAQEKAKEMFAETSERMQDIYAEAKHEYEEEAVTMKAESDIMPEPEMEQATKPAEGAKRTPRTRKTEPETEAE